MNIMAQNEGEINGFMPRKYKNITGAHEKQIIERSARIFAANQAEKPQEYFVYFKGFQ